MILILDRFTLERKEVLDAILQELRKMDFKPVIVDFSKLASRDVTGTVETLARIARFVVADITDPLSIPHELASIIPHMRTTPILTLKLKGEKLYSMFNDFQAYPWVLPTHEYLDGPSLITELSEVIKPANYMAEGFRRRG